MSILDKRVVPRHLYKLLSDGEKLESLIPDFYAMPKLHKDPISSRPICPSQKWITSHVSRFLDTLLSPFLASYPWILRDTPSLIRAVGRRRFPAGTILISFDVESMYPSLPITETVMRITS